MSARKKTPAQVLREIAESDPVGHGQRLARAYGAGPEPTVDVPVSLIERATDYTTPRRTRDRHAAIDELRALLAQPTPSAEPPMCGAISAFTSEPCVEEAGHSGRHISIRGLSWEPLAWWEPTAEPPRIEDMAPGTTFEYGERWTVGHNLPGQPPHAHRGLEARYLDQFDPSTIRDVTPPTNG